MKKKCIVCRKVKPVKEFALNGRSPRCEKCKKEFDAKKKPGGGFFGL